MHKVVGPRLWANGLRNPFTNKKKYTIQCGNCKHTWDEKVPDLVDEASAVCPSCGAQNMWSHSEFGRRYESWLEQQK